jgi:hypothetical protein
VAHRIERTDSSTLTTPAQKPIPSRRSGAVLALTSRRLGPGDEATGEQEEEAGGWR